MRCLYQNGCGMLDLIGQVINPIHALHNPVVQHRQPCSMVLRTSLFAGPS